LSTDFPISAGTLHTTNQGGTDGFATILDNTLSNLIASTYLGTSSFDHAYKMQIDNLDNVYVCGQTDGAYPVTAGLYTNPGSGIFIEKLNPTLTASLSSTVIGQTASNLVPTAFLYDVCGNIYFSGFQAQAGLPLSANAYQTTPGGFWLCVLENNMTQLLYATFMGAAGDHVDGGTSRFDPGGIIYHSVCTASSSQYNSAGAWSPTNMAGSWDVASFKFNFETLGLNATINITPNTDSACAPATIPFINNTLNATNYIWDFGDGSPTSNAVSPSHTYTSAGIYTVTLIAYNPNSCALSDTDQVMVHIFEMNSPKVSTKDTAYCDPNAMLQLGATISNLNNNMSYSWQPSSGVLQGQNTLSPLINPATSLSYTITVLDSISALCKKSSQAVVNITFGDTSLFKVYPEDTIVCEGEKVLLMAEGGIKYTWQPATNINDIHAQYIEFKALSPITFSVLIEDTNGCKGTRYANIDLFPKTQVNAGENQIIKYNTGTQLAASGASQYAWNYDVSLSNLTINNPSASPSIATNYIVTGTDVNGCLSKDTVRIDITNLIIPNAFSPNGDLLNDQIKVVTANNLVDFSSLKIYNRWGKLMFSTKDANIGWDGKFNGINCEIGTYYYLLTYSIGNKTYTEKGDISLLR
jgi:gliding motility-associated-like protein